MTSVEIPKQEAAVSDQVNSDLVEIARRSSDFKKNFGENRGVLLTAWMAHLATRRDRPILRPGWIIALVTAVATAWKYWSW